MFHNILLIFINAKILISFQNSSISLKKIWFLHSFLTFLQGKNSKVTKSDPKVARYKEKDLLILLGLSSLRFRSLLLLFCFIELDSHEYYSAMLDSVSILPLLWLFHLLWQENTAEVGAKDGYTLKVKARGNAPRIASPKKDMKTKPHLRMWQHGTMEYTKWVPEEATVCRSMQ